MRPCVLVRLKSFRRKDKGKLGLKSRFIGLPGGGAAQSTEDTRNAAYKLVRGVIRHPRAQQSTALIETCAEMCQTEGVNFTEVLEDTVIEGRGVLFWIIMESLSPDQYGLVSAILNHSGPPSSRTIYEIDRACTMFLKHALFAYLWTLPAYHGLSGMHEPSFGSTSPADHVWIDCSHREGSIYRLRISQFHKRISTSGRIVLKFMTQRLSPS